MTIRKATEKNYPQIAKILHNIQNVGDSYFFENMNNAELLKYWLKSDFTCFVYEKNDEIFGSYILGAIAKGRFSHTANARGKGIGKLLMDHSISSAKKFGFKAMQFQRVVSTNFAAVKSWQNAGFRIIGTIPKAFRHKSLGLVDAYIFHREL